jgi:hypothetical protein
MRRANGSRLARRCTQRFYISADFALPRGLDPDNQVALVRDFAREVTEKERLSYSLAIDAGLDSDGQEHSPHAHVMISERQNDGIERSRETWFRRGGWKIVRVVNGRQGHWSDPPHLTT